MLNTLQLLFIQQIFAFIIRCDESQRCRDKVDLLHYLFGGYMIAEADITQRIIQIYIV